MSSPDPISIVALLISVIAVIFTFVQLLLTIIQVLQQFFGTSPGYLHCSVRTIGGWHRRTRRRFVLGELRVEIYFATPTIHVDVASFDGASEKTYAVPTSASPTGGAQYILRAPEGDTVYSSSQKPWFLDRQGTQDEARCAWLSLLNDVTIAHLQIGIDERTFLYDFMPDGIKKPLAQMDRKSFLTLMSLFQISWQEGWGKETGGKGGLGGGRREIPTGNGPYCEVTSRNIVNFGTIISYHPLYLPSTRRLYIVSEKARSAMFNRFDLGFHVVLTHSPDEVYRTALALSDEDAASTIQSFYEANNGYAPGLAEVISCFAEPEMPKAIEHGTDKFLSIFSARSLGTIFDTHAVGRLLEGDSEIENADTDTKELARWAEDYISSSSSIKDDIVRLPPDQVKAALKIASRYFGTEVQQRQPISWSESRKCLDVMKLLDQQLSTLSSLVAPNLPELNVNRDFAQLQIRSGSTLFDDACTKAEPSGGFWRDFIGVVVAGKYVEICSEMRKKYPGSSDEVTQGYVINRMMRGILWRIHNGNCSTNETHDERYLECSLGSHWLSDTSTIWID